jgi:hypothetical protein
MAHYGPPQGGQPYGPPPQQQFQPAPPPAPRNGLGLAALICGGIGVLFGLVAIGFVVAGPLAVVAVALGITGMSRARKGLATNGGVATIGMLLGIAAALMSISGANRVFTAVDTVRSNQQQTVDCMQKAIEDGGDAADILNCGK